ncbi:unnamed protein product [Brassicogethes aeneus]|uniref:Calponin-homology (CH) domain-containing protein n=1 Tax=Brassicogethes aeneus TaxID=1431903 RepID=A0A9P0B375_BRAAE|nr:unnamed protein product [Brassicogethes aeneus]
MEIDCDELYKWIDEHPITRQKRNINRDFSDAVPLAEILKQHYPKLVELHNYSPQNAIQPKINNWNALNKKVLRKLQINLTPETVDNLSKAVPGTIEKLLYEVKKKIETFDCGDRNITNTPGKIYYLEGLSNYGSIIPIKVKNGSKIVDQKMVPSEIFDKMEKDLAEKTEEIINLKNKVEHLENLLHVKDERINDLTNQLQNLENDPNSPNPKGRFFNNLF